jgi:diguanylate cyclase (GGDEF)-like protein/PAS domain S-box-containing protein
MLETLLECILAILFAGSALLLARKAGGKFAGHGVGINFLIAGFTLLAISFLLDITNNYPSLAAYEFIGPTRTEALIQRFIQLSAVILLLMGANRILPESVRNTLLRRSLDTERQLHRASDKLLAEKDRDYRNLIDIANNIILRWKPDGEITFINPFGEAFFMYQPGELVGKNVVGTIVPETETTGKDLRAMISDIIIHPDHYEQNLNENALKNGERRWIQWSNKAIHDTDGNLTELLSVGSDATNSQDARMVLEALASSTQLQGKQFYSKIIRLLAEAYRASYAYIGIFSDDQKNRIRVLSLWDGESVSSGFEYDLADTPCAMTVTGQTVHFETGIKQHFPKDEILIDWGADSYYATPIKDNNNEITGLIGVVDKHALTLTPWTKPVINIFADRIAAELQREKINAEQRLAAQVFLSSHDGIIIMDGEFRIQRVNHAFLDISGYSEEEVIGYTIRQFGVGENDPEHIQEMLKKLELEGHWRGEALSRRKDGSEYPAWLTLNVIRNTDDQVTNHIAMISDITELKTNEKHVYKLAHFDTLTGLANRILFHDRLFQASVRARRSRQHFALLYIDLDRFKPVNDSYGHEIGDKVLIEVSNRLKGLIRESDTLARMGGDEFALILNDLPDIDTLSRIASNLSEQILAQLEQCIRIDNKEIFISGSIGIASYPDDAQNEADLVRHADTAMYHAKESGRNNYRFFEQHMNEAASLRLRTETDLRQALSLNQIEIHYQPALDLETGDVHSFEALARWYHPDVGMVSPEQFIDVAEETGLIMPLGYMVLEKACRQMMRWMRLGYDDIRIAVNISLRQMRDKDLVARVKHILDTTGLSPNHLTLEITESTFIDDIEHSSSIIDQLCYLGVSLAIDDFGTGYSSLSQLKRLPVDALKIDRSFVEGIEHDLENEGIVSATIAMAHRMKLKIIAEGVETEEQMKHLKSLGCDFVQGYYISAAMTPEKSTQFLEDNRKRPLQNEFALPT